MRLAPAASRSRRLRNLLAQPDVTVQVGAEPTHLWETTTGIWPLYAGYQRRIPNVIVERPPTPPPA
ncbi:hypothetical protein AB0C33_44925 [Nonomuraea sp. NPDC048881]|uniref:hypothetical protein n=1 Tax=Nonomuraea sp. NPDC048881 TaxID=3155030 RepID=UPI0034058385